MNYSPDKEMNQFLQMAERTGWTIEHPKGGHWKLKAPNGRTSFASSTPSDHNAARNAQRELKKVWPEWHPEGEQHIKKAKRQPPPCTTAGFNNTAQSTVHPVNKNSEAQPKHAISGTGARHHAAPHA